MPTEIREALNALNVSALIQKVIDPDLLEYQRRLSPLLAMIPTQKWSSTTYFFNTRTQRPGGGFVADGGARPQSSSTYVQKKFDMAHVETIGGVTGFAQEVTRDLIGDLQLQEINGAIASLGWDLETAIDWGNAAATANGPWPQFDGFDSQVSQFSPNLSAGMPANAIDCAGAQLTFSLLNQLIDLVQRNAAMPVLNANYMLVGSTTAISKIASILTNTQQRLVNVSVADAGLNAEGYRGLPLIASSFLAAGGLTMSTVSGGTATTGGTLPMSTTYKYVVDAIIARLGETVGCGTVTQATGGSTNTNTITLSFTPPTGYEGGGPVLYKVFRDDGAAGTISLLGTVDAVVGTTSDGITPIMTNQIVDTGTALIPQNSTGPVTPAIPPTAYFGTNAGHLPRRLDADGSGNAAEDIYLVCRMKDFVLRPYVRDIRSIPVYPTVQSPDTLPFALISDTCLATRAPKYLGRLRNVGVTL